jgi:hypothetical protein
LTARRPVRAEVSGKGWTLSLQRQAGSPRPGVSSNLGAAPLARLGGRGAVRRLAARLAPGERLWVAVMAPRGTEVAARLHDGRALADEVLADPQGDEVIHRLARTEGSDRDGVDRGDSDALTVTVGSGRRLEIELVDAADFDAQFGPPPPDGDPPAYAGWRLP